MMDLIGQVFPFGRLRRAHGLEHATIRVLSERYPNTSFAGRSTAEGFMLYGDVSTEEVASAIDEAMRRMRGGEHSLAIHPRCGTNLVVAGVLAGVSSFAASAGRPRPLGDRLARLMLASTAAVLAAQPLGPMVQERLTTSPDVDGLEVTGIERRAWRKAVMHRVHLRPRRS